MTSPTSSDTTSAVDLFEQTMGRIETSTGPDSTAWELELLRDGEQEGTL